MLMVDFYASNDSNNNGNYDEIVRDEFYSPLYLYLSYFFPLLLYGINKKWNVLYKYSFRRMCKDHSPVFFIPFATKNLLWLYGIWNRNQAIETTEAGINITWE